MRKYASRKQLINEKIAYLKTSIEQKYGWELNLDYENKYIKLWSLTWYNINKAKGVSMQVKSFFYCNLFSELFHDQSQQLLCIIVLIRTKLFHQYYKRRQFSPTLL